MVLYDNVKQACREKGVSVSALEKAVGFSNGCISKWNESEPGIRKVQKVADYLGVAIEDLLEQGGERDEERTGRRQKEESTSVENVDPFISNYSDSDSVSDVADEPEDLEGFGSAEPGCDSAWGSFERSSEE